MNLLLLVGVAVCLCFLQEVVTDSMSCPVGYFTPNNAINSCSECWLGADMIYCNDKEAYIEVPFFLTAENGSYPLTIGPVIFGLYRGEGLNSRNLLYRQLPSQISELNSFFCSDSHRQGYLCSQCMEGCGIATYTYYGLPCACPCSDYGLPLYLFLEFGFSTLFFVLVFATKFSVNSSKWFGIVFFFQNVALTINLNPRIYTFFAKNRRYLPVLLHSVCGIWNMDFFRLAIPEFCVSQTMSTHSAITTGYISAFWPLVLILFISLAIKLHRHNFKIVLYLWQLINRISSGAVQRRFADTNLIHTFATFFLLSYLKTILVTCMLLGVVSSYHLTSENGSFTKLHLQSMDPNIRYFDVIFAVPAFTIFILIGVFLPLVLILYPTRCGSWLFACRRWKMRKLRLVMMTFIEAIHGMYKDGTNGTRDYRAIPGIILLLRVCVVFLFTFRGNTAVQNTTKLIPLISGALTMIMGLFYGLAKPYKMEKHNLFEVLLYCLTAIDCFFIFIEFSLWSNEKSMIHAVVVITFIPLIVAVIAVFKQLFTTVFWNVRAKISFRRI